MLIKELIKKDGTKVPLQSRKDVTRIESATQNVTFMEQDTISMSIRSTVKQDFQIGDSINLYGKTYRLNRFPTINKKANNDISYNLEFESAMYELGCVSYNLSIELTGNVLQDVQSESLIGNLNRFMSVLIGNMNRNYPDTWALGTCPSTANDVFLSFNDTDTCLSVLNILCERFETEYEIVESNGVNTINLGQAGEDKNILFEYGRGRGLYELNRDNVDAQNMCTRLMAYGGEENITIYYRANRLLLPEKTRATSYIEDAAKIAQYRLFEKTKYFSDVYPTRIGRVTAAIDRLTFRDSSMNFDLSEKWKGYDDFFIWCKQKGLEAITPNLQVYNNNVDGQEGKYIISGIDPKICFLSGNLAGYTFIIDSYNHTLREFKIKPAEVDGGQIYPSKDFEAFRFQNDDTYKLIDVSLPQSYVDSAESRLQEAAQEYFDKNSVPRAQYSVNVTARYLQTKLGTYASNLVKAGDSYRVIDGDLGVDEYLRVISYTRNLIKEDEYTLTLAEFKRKKFVDGLVGMVFDSYRKLEVNQLSVSPSSHLANTLSTSELNNKIFDGGLLRIDKIGDFSIPSVKLDIAKQATNKGDYVVSAGGNTFTIEKRAELVIEKDEENIIWHYEGNDTEHVIVALADLKGTDGTNGTNGTSAYVHIRWGTSATPSSLLTTPADYIGIYSGTSATAPTTYNSYTWYKYKGTDGIDGIDGTNGKNAELRISGGYIQWSIAGSGSWANLVALADLKGTDGTNGTNGTSAYVHIRWGTSATPSSLLTTPADYIGIYSGTSATAPTTYNSYTWYKYKGTDGLPGTPGIGLPPGGIWGDVLSIDRDGSKKWLSRNIYKLVQSDEFSIDEPIKKMVIEISRETSLNIGIPVFDSKEDVEIVVFNNSAGNARIILHSGVRLVAETNDEQISIAVAPNGFSKISLSPVYNNDNLMCVIVK